MCEECSVLRQQLADRNDAMLELWLELAMAEQWREIRERTIARLIERSKQFTQCRRDRDHWFSDAMQQTVRADKAETAARIMHAIVMHVDKLDSLFWAHGTGSDEFHVQFMSLHEAMLNTGLLSACSAQGGR